MSDSLDPGQPTVWAPVQALRHPTEEVIANAQSGVLNEWLRDVVSTSD